MLQKAIRNLKNQEGEGEGGFTLIELLVVILIIGILAAIALPTFLGQSNKAKDSSAKSDVRNAVSQIESCMGDGDKDPSVCTVKATNPELAQFDSLQGDYQTADDATDTYTVTATSKTGNTFTISKVTSGGFRRACTAVKAGGGCSGTSASW